MGFTSRVVAFFLATACATCGLACAGAPGSGALDNGVYRQGPIAFQLPPAPASWRRIDISHASLAFRDDANAASILVNARCGKTYEDTPLVALTNQLVIGSTEREIGAQVVEPFDQREAVHTTMRAKWDGVPRHLDIFVAKKDGCVYDFVWIAPAPATAEFGRFVHGFRTLPGSGTAG